MPNQIVTFVVDKELDIKNNLTTFNFYKRNKERGFQQRLDENFEKYLKLASEEEIRSEIEKNIKSLYEKEGKLLSLADDINKEWIKIEGAFISKLEKVYKFPFPYTSIKGVLSSASRWGYSLTEGWFATGMFRNKFFAIDTAAHELSHFMFHKYYDKVCEEKGLSKNQMWDVKEAFTVLLNIEFGEFMFQTDSGYAPHAKLREVIAESWRKYRDFDKVLAEAIAFVCKIKS